MEGESRANQGKTESTVIAKLAVKQFCETRRLYLSNMLYKIMERLVRTSLKWFLLYLASALAALIMHFLAIVIGLDNQLSAYSWLKCKNDLIKKFLCLMGLIFIPSKER